MSKLGLARRWYVPIEVLTLRLWLSISILTNLLLMVIDWLREDTLSLQLALLGTVTLSILWWVLPDGKAVWKRDTSIFKAGLTLIIGVLRFGAGPQMAIDFWLAGWMIGPATLAIWWLSSPNVSAWAKGRITIRGAELGLSRNKVLAPRLGAIGSHILLMHAVFVVLIPVLWILNVALTPGNMLGGDIRPSEWTGEHFSKILDPDSSFWIWLRNSIIVSLGTTVMGLSLAVPAAYAFSRFRFRGRDSAMFAFLLVQMFPGIIILVPYFLVMKTLGLLNTSLGLILAYSVTALPLCVWMLKGFFDTVPRELEEAALLDGCNQAQVFQKVVLPLSIPAVAVTALFSFLAAWNEYLLALTFNTSNDMYTLPVGLASLISSTGQAWGDFAAASLLVSLPVAILFIVFQKFLIQGLSAGGVKG
ncbi:MAG: sugar ABC transporter permease [Candidatus Thalassarchaeaceae archaeon]|jgi:arabinogalactan oligomer/maltooligosaccharide transport system permease protein|nr:sugar ABC transporter permease [Candidatus Thalassarchaeaceae archaeon]